MVNILLICGSGYKSYVRFVIKGTRMVDHVTTVLSLGGTILTGVLIAAASSWITVRLSLRRFQTERLWERRVENYQRIIDLLHDSGVYFDAMLEAEINGHELTDEKKERLRTRTTEGREQLEKQIDISSLFISREARDRLIKFRRELNLIKKSNDYIDFLEGHCVAISGCLESIIAISKKDLHIK